MLALHLTLLCILPLLVTRLYGNLSEVFFITLILKDTPLGFLWETSWRLFSKCLTSTYVPFETNLIEWAIIPDKLFLNGCVTTIKKKKIVFLDRPQVTGYVRLGLGRSMFASLVNFLIGSFPDFCRAAIWSFLHAF